MSWASGRCRPWGDAATQVRAIANRDANPPAIGSMFGCPSGSPEGMASAPPSPQMWAAPQQQLGGSRGVGVRGAASGAVGPWRSWSPAASPPLPPAVWLALLLLLLLEAEGSAVGAPRRRRRRRARCSSAAPLGQAGAPDKPLQASRAAGPGLCPPWCTQGRRNWTS